MNTITGPTSRCYRESSRRSCRNPRREAAETTTTGTTTTELPPPQYLSLAFARTTVETLGLDLPRTPEDTLAILSAVQQALDKTVDETRTTARRRWPRASALRSPDGPVGSGRWTHCTRSS